jgi:hypothetical protein
MLHVSGQSSGQTFLTTVSPEWRSAVATAWFSRDAKHDYANDINSTNHHDFQHRSGWSSGDCCGCSLGNTHSSRVFNSCCIKGNNLKIDFNGIWWILRRFLAL